MKKKEKTIKNENNKNLKLKKTICIIVIIFLIIILFFLFRKVYDNLLYKKTFENSIISFAEKNEKEIFTIDKIIFFSSSDSKNKTSTSSNFTIENLYTYTDIAIFINNNAEENTLENTIKSLKIKNIKISKEPSLGKPNLYFKSIKDFTKSEFDESNLMENEYEFEITSEDEVDLTKPILYNNCANPITMTYINQNIKTDYTMIDTENPITYNGMLLKRCGIALSSIEASVLFDVDIENNKNQKFKTTVYFDIPYENEGASIYDGTLMLKKENKFNFYRYE